MEILRLFLYFFIYSILGWILESVYKSILFKKWVNSGFLHGPLCPIYGIGALIMILFLNSFKNNIFLLFIIGFIVLSIWEYFVGWLLETLFKTKYWDYSQNKFNIKGRVCLLNSIIWGVLGIIFIGFIHPIMENKIVQMPISILIWIDAILMILLVVDIILSVIKVNKINSALDKFKDLGDSLKQKLEELEQLNIKQTAFEKLDDVKEAIDEKIENVKDGIEDKIEDLKENFEDKIKGIEKSIEELKLKQNAINVEFYKKAKRIKQAFPTMKSEKMNLFVEQKIDVKKLKKDIQKNYKRRNK